MRGSISALTERPNNVVPNMINPELAGRMPSKESTQQNAGRAKALRINGDFTPSNVNNGRKNDGRLG